MYIHIYITPKPTGNSIDMQSLAKHQWDESLQSTPDRRTISELARSKLHESVSRGTCLTNQRGQANSTRDNHTRLCPICQVSAEHHGYTYTLASNIRCVSYYRDIIPPTQSTPSIADHMFRFMLSMRQFKAMFWTTSPVMGVLLPWTMWPPPSSSVKNTINFSFSTPSYKRRRVLTYSPRCTPLAKASPAIVSHISPQSRGLRHIYIYINMLLQ